MSNQGSAPGGGGRVSGYGLSATLPPGWEGRITQLAPVAPSPAATPAAHAAHVQAPLTPPPTAETTKPFMHLASFPLPPSRGTFGSGAVELMAQQDALIALVEYTSASVGTALFSRPSLPTNLAPQAFHPRALQRILPGQGGYQAFFHTSGRPFCLYVVLGSLAHAPQTLPTVNQTLTGIQVAPG